MPRGRSSSRTSHVDRKIQDIKERFDKDTRAYPDKKTSAILRDIAWDFYLEAETIQQIVNGSYERQLEKRRNGSKDDSQTEMEL